MLNMNITTTVSSSDNILTIGTHNGVFHADECMSVAILRMANHEDVGIEVVRTRNPKELALCHLRVDVGGNYDPTSGDYDHHQGTAGERWDSEIPYSSAGLIWSHFGKELCSSEKAWDRVDRQLIAPIDGVDCGWNKKEENSFSFSAMISSLNIDWNEERTPETEAAAFTEAVELCYRTLQRTLASANSSVLAEEIVLRDAMDPVDSPILILSQFCPWQNPIFENGLSHIQYVLFQAPTGDWRVQCVPKELGSFKTRKPLPKAWKGLNGEALAEVSGVHDAVFCHMGRFICGAKSYEGALALANAAVKA